MSIIGFPLLLIPLAICNIVVFLMPGLGFDAALAQLALPSGVTWSIGLGDTLIALGALLLLLEVIKAGRPGARYAVDHLLSLLVLIAAIGEFALLPPFGNSTVFLLATLALVDFLAGVGLRGRRPRTAATVAPVPADPAPDLPEQARPTASAAAKSIAEAVLLDRPEPVFAPAQNEPSPQIVSPGLQPGDDATAAPTPR